MSCQHPKISKEMLTKTSQDSLTNKLLSALITNNLNMGKISKIYALFLALIIALSSQIIFYWTPLGLAQSGTNVSGLLT